MWINTEKNLFSSNLMGDQRGDDDASVESWGIKTRGPNSWQWNIKLNFISSGVKKS